MTKEEIKKIINEKYPNVEIKNGYFIDEEVFNTFPFSTVVNVLLQLSIDQAFTLYMHLYRFGNTDCKREMIKYIICENPEYIRNDDKDLYTDTNIIKEYTRLYGGKEHTLEELKEIERLNIKNNGTEYDEFVNFDINFYNEFIIIQKLYKERKLKYNDILPFINQILEKLKKNIIRTEGNYYNKYDNNLNEIISNLLLGNIKPEEFYDCTNNYYKVKNLITVSKLGIMIYKFNSAPIEVLGTIKGKQILNIYNDFMKISNLDRIKENYNKEKILTIITNMSLLLGYDNVNNIIRHLPQDIIKVDRLFSAFQDIDLTNIKTENGNIIYNNDLIKLFIGNNLEEPNNLLNLIYEGKTNLKDKIETLYAYWDILEERYKMQPLKTKLGFLEEALNSTMIILNPNEYLLEGDIINSYYDNKKFQHSENINLIKQVREEYQKMKYNYQKTIPYVSGNYENYTYETLKANDPNLFVMGSVSDCCFKIGGDADSFVKYCAENPNGRVLAIKNQRGKIVAMVPMVRNGNLILCNSVESTMTSNHDFMKKMFEILEIVGNKMINISEKKENDSNKIHAMLIGGYKNEISEIKEYKKVEYGEIDDKCIYPLDTTIYANMGGYDNYNYIIASIPNLNYNNLKSFVPRTLYNDPRKEPLEIEKEYITENIKKVVNSVYYEINKTVPNYENIEKIIFNEDWIIIIDKKYKIESYIVSKDERAYEEYEEYLYLAQEHCSYYNEDGSIKEEAYYR